MPPEKTDGTDPPEGSGSDGAGSLTEARVQELISKAIGSRLDAYDKKIAKTLESRLGDTVLKVTQVLDEKLDALKPTPQDPSDKSKDLDIENHPIVKGLKKRLDEADAKTKQIEETAAAEKAKARSATLRTRLADVLTAHGITGQRQIVALGHLIDAKHAVDWSEDDPDALVFREGKDALDLKTGLEGWVKSEEGKLFLPPRGGSGSGENPPRGGPRNANSSDQPSKSDLGTALMRAVTR